MHIPRESAYTQRACVKWLIILILPFLRFSWHLLIQALHIVICVKKAIAAIFLTPKSIPEMDRNWQKQTHIPLEFHKKKKQLLPSVVLLCNTLSSSTSLTLNEFHWKCNSLDNKNCFVLTFSTLPNLSSTYLLPHKISFDVLNTPFPPLHFAFSCLCYTHYFSFIFALSTSPICSHYHPYIHT